MELSDCVDSLHVQQKRLHGQIMDAQEQLQVVNRALRAYTVMCNMLDLTDMDDEMQFQLQYDLKHNIDDPDWIINKYCDDSSKEICAIIKLAMFQ